MSEKSTFTRNATCTKGGGNVVISGEMSVLRDYERPGKEVLDRHVRVKSCSGAAACGATLPAVSGDSRCIVADNLKMTG